MKRFLIMLAIFFGFALTWQTIRIMSQQKYAADVNVKQFDGKTVQVVAPDLFAERNMYEIFEKRYRAKLKMVFENTNAAYLDLKKTGDAAVFPSFAYEKLVAGGTIQPVDVERVPNLSTLMDHFTDIMKKEFSKEGKTRAIPVAYMPVSFFFNIEKIQKTTKGVDLLRNDVPIALADHYGTFLALARVLNLPLNEKSVGAVRSRFGKDNVLFFNPDTPGETLEKLAQFKPAIIVAPSFLTGLFERQAGTLEMILPDEGTYADLYLLAPLKTEQTELVHVLINHMTDPQMQKGLTSVLKIPVTNKVSLNSMEPVLYNSLKMNDPSYFGKIHRLRTAREFETALSLYSAFRNSFGAAGK